jgi:APA family basic amino acid/polyamine antiporter
MIRNEFKEEPMPALREQVLRRKPVEEMAAETGADTGHGELKRTVGLWSLSAIGIGGTIGTGIFFILSQAAPMAGPAVIWSFIIAGAVAGLTAVCYAELAGAVPVAGSSYSYTTPLSESSWPWGSAPACC